MWVKHRIRGSLLLVAPAFKAITPFFSLECRKTRKHLKDEEFGKELGVVRSAFRTVLDDYGDVTRKEGRKEGLEKNRNKTARAMLAKGYSPQEIMEITGISGERLQKLAESR
jgi:hypothetical protein